MGSTPAPTLPPDIARIMANLQQSRLSPFQNVSLAWLALAPSWTERLATSCKFPLGSFTDLESFLRASEKASLCSRAPEQEARNARIETARTLAALWPFLKPAHQIGYRARLLADLEAIPNLEESLTLQLRAAAADSSDPARFTFVSENIQQVADPESRARLLVLAANLRRDESSARQAWAGVADVRSATARATLRLSLPLLSPDDLLADIRAIDEPDQKALLLVRLAQLSPERTALIEEAMTCIRETEDPATQSLCFALLSEIPYAAGLLGSAIDQVSNINDPGARVRAMVVLASHCSDPRMGASVLDSAWSTALSIQDTNESTRLLAIVASQIAAAGLPVSPNLPNPESLSEVLLAVAAATPASPPGKRGAAIQAARNAISQVPLKSLRNSLLIRLGAIAPSPVTPEALQAAQALTGDTERRNALISVVPALSPNERPGVVANILASIQRVADPVVRRTCFLQLAPFLDDGQLSFVLQIVTSVVPDRGFRAPDSARTQVFEYLKGKESIVFLETQASQIGRAILGATSNTVPADLARWAALASRVADSSTQSGSAAAYLGQQVVSLVDSGDTGSALEWLQAGQLLAAALGGNIDSEVLLGRHRVALAYRQAMDELHLRHYQERPELQQAFIDLRDEPTSPQCRWALHYLGVGGVGKTMLLRYITARLAVREGRRLPTSRVDFDHISPEFPVRKPGQLLAELADELRVHGGANLESRFAEFQDQLRALHTRLESEPAPDNPLKNVLAPDFENVMAAFADLLVELPSPVILILDTCEELAKLEPVGTTLPSVEATFRILEFLQKKVPTLRVVLAGRRLLARGGDGQNGVYEWTVAEGPRADRIRYLPERKDYLRLALVRGFNRTESGLLLERMAGHLDTPRTDAILARSPEAGTPPELVFRPPRPGDRDPRFNPFDLALYGEWLREDSSVTAETIRGGGTDPWVEMRIIRRLESEILKQILPAVVLLRRCNLEMLSPVLPANCDPETVFRDLGGHEWNDMQRDEDLQVWFVEVNPNLLPRLETFFQRVPWRADSEAARKQLAPALEALVRSNFDKEQPFARLHYSLVDAALRLLPSDQAVELWDKLDEVLTSRAEWAWALKVCPQLLGEEDPGSNESLLRLQIRATLNAALLHLQRDFDPASSWAPMLTAAVSGPRSEVREWLTVRATIFSAKAEIELSDAFGNLKRISDPRRRAQAFACFLARVSWMLENAPDTLQLPFDEFAVTSGFAVGTGFAELEIYDRVLHWRWLEKIGEAADWDIISHVRPDFPQPLQRWADWRIPASFIDRMRLEVLRPDSDSRPDYDLLKRWREQALARLDNIDSERLISRTLQIELAWRPVNLAECDGIAAKKYYDPARIPEAAVHSATPPLFVELAEAWASNGRADLVDDMRGKLRLEFIRGRQGTEELDQLGLRLAHRFRQREDPKFAISTPAYDKYLSEKASGNNNPPVIKPRELALGALGRGSLDDSIRFAVQGEAPLDAFFASTLLALYYIRIDWRTEATAALVRVADFYENARQKHPLSWPDFEVIQRAELPPEALLPDWLIRAAAAVAWSSRDADLEARVASLIDRRYPVVPSELEPPPHVPPLEKLKKEDPQDARWLMVLGFVVIAGFILALFFGFRWAYQRFHEDLWTALSVIVGIPIYYFVLRWMASQLWHIPNYGRKPRLRIEALASGGIQVYCLELAARPAPKWFPLILRINPGVEKESRKLQLPELRLARYRDTATALRDVLKSPGFLNPVLSAVAAAPIQMDIAQSLESYPWEAFLTEFTAPRRSWQSLLEGDAPGTPKERIRFWRGIPQPWIEQRQPPSWSYGHILLICRPTLRRDFEPTWLDAGLRVFVASGVPSESITENTKRALHLIGRARRSGSSNVLQIGGADSDTFVQASDLPLSDSYLVIVQSPPVDTLRRTDSDRLHHSELRLFCRDLFDAKAHSVLFLPQMPFETSKSVNRILAGACKKGSPPGLWKLLDLVGGIRKLIWVSVGVASVDAGEQGVQSDSADLLDAKEETAMDVTLWTRLTK